MPLRDEQGRPVRLSAGWRIFFFPHERVIKLQDRRQGTIVWPAGDDKLMFPGGEVRFQMLADIIAQTHGFFALPIKKTSSIVAFEFVNEYVEPAERE